MKPPLANLLRFAILFVVSLLLLCFTPTTALAADVADAGRSAAHSLTVAELVGLIALGFLPALYMIGRARQAR